MHRGHIKLFRRIREHWIFQDPEDLKAWLVILLEVNHCAKKVKIGRRVLDCARGEALYSYDTWATKFGKGWNKSRVRRFLSLLQSEKMVDIKSDTHTTRLTVVNYNAFHDCGNESETIVKQDCNDIETTLTPTKEFKNEKNEKNENHHPTMHGVVQSNGLNINALFFSLRGKQPNAFETSSLIEITKAYSPEQITDAFQKAGKAGADLRYVEAVLKGDAKNKQPKKPEHDPEYCPPDPAIFATLKAHGVSVPEGY